MSSSVGLTRLYETEKPACAAAVSTRAKQKRKNDIFLFIIMYLIIFLYWSYNYRRNWRANSHMTMPAVTDTFMECFVPY